MPDARPCVLKFIQMKEHISFDPVEGVSIAIAEQEDPLDPHWRVFLINSNARALSNVIVVSKGYSGLGTERVKTSVLRHMFEAVEANSAVLVEPIDPEIFHLTNEFWVSYYIGTQVYDKKFIFVPDSIVAENLIPVALLNRKAVLHK